jgi:hypothetical protein
MRFQLWRIMLASVASTVSVVAAPPEAEARVAAWLKTWDSQGVHRTGTTGDEAGAAWLAREAAAIAGPVVKSESFDFERIDTVAAFVEIDGERIDGEAFLDAPATGPNGIRAAATDAAGAGPIAVLPLPPSAVYGADFARMRRVSTHRAHVIVTLGGQPGLAPLNAESFLKPFGPPTVQVSSVERDRIVAALARRAEFRVVVNTTRTPAKARNVVLTIPGRDRGRTPVVVMTPRSSWWQSTAERGGGIVCWLETLRALLAAPPSGPVIFTANTGHELGHLGLDDFIARRRGWDRSVGQGGAGWVHYGANIGAAGGTLSLVSPDDDLRDIAAAELGRAGQPHELAPKTLVPSGETRDIHRAGGRYLTLVGTNPLFHLPQDRWPDAVDLDAVTRIAAASARMVLALTRG